MNDEQPMWTVEGNGRYGKNFLVRDRLTDDEVAELLAALLKDPQTGGVVVYRTPLTA